MPVLESKKGKKDIPLLEMLVDKVKEKNLQKEKGYEIDKQLYKGIIMQDIRESKQVIKEVMQTKEKESEKDNIEDEIK